MSSWLLSNPVVDLAMSAAAAVNTAAETSSAPQAAPSILDLDGDTQMTDDEDLDDRILHNLDEDAISINMDNSKSVVRTFPRYVPVDISSIPTLLPEPIAAIITGLAGTSRVSFRLLSFFTEAILETSQCSTRMYMGYSRRFFITMISSARRVYIASNKLKQGNLLGAAGFTDEPLGEADGFLQVLDRYTNLGIYIIHHGHTLAELFAMSGFFISSAATSGSNAAAQLTVGLFDDLFGSNESSRMLSAIISMLSKEVLDDERFKAKNHGGVRIFASLTRALTAFVCLQFRTWKSTSERLKMKLVYDCTVIQEKESSMRRLEAASPPLPLGNSSASSSFLLNPSVPAPEASSSAIPASIPLQHLSHRAASAAALVQSKANSRVTHHDRQASTHSTTLNGLQGNLQEYAQGHNTLTSIRSNRSSVVLGSLGMQDLLFDGSYKEEKQMTVMESQPDRRVKRSWENTYQITDEYRESTITTQTFEQMRTTEIQLPPTHAQAHLRHDRTRSINASASVQNSNTLQMSPHIYDLAGQSLPHLQHTSPSAENDWIEVDELLAGDDGEILHDAQLPSSPNGGTASPGSYRDLSEYNSTERIQLVLRTMTDKLLQRKRTIRRMSSGEEDATAPEEATRGGESARTPLHRSRAASPTRSMTRKLSAPSPGTIRASSPTSNIGTPQTKRRAYPSTPKKVSPIQKAISRARTAFRPLTSSRQQVRSSSPTQDDSILPRPSTPEPESLMSPPASPKMSLRAPPPTPAPTIRQIRPTSSMPPRLFEALPQYDNASSRHDRHPSHAREDSVPAICQLTESETQSSADTYQESTTRSSPLTTNETPERLFPHDTLTNNIHRFMRFSSAAYGQYFLRILGMGDSDILFPSTDKYHGNTWSFAQHTNLPIENILLSSYTDSSPIFGDQKAPPIVHYIAVDHAMKAVVLTCRGTLGVSDVLIDLTCEYCSIDLESDDPDAEFYAHSGMYHAAMRMTARSSTVHETLIRALKDNPTYGLVVTGHSLGGGVAALITLAWSSPANKFTQHNLERKVPVSHPPIGTPFVTSLASGLPPGRPIHCYTYGIPAIASPDLANYAKRLITAVIHDNDVVPTLSLGILRDLKNVALTLSDEGWTAESIITRVLGVNPFKFGSEVDLSSLNPFTYLRRMATASVTRDAMTHPPGTSQEQLVSDWMMSLIKTMRADMDNDKLFPPGDVYIIEAEETFVTVTEATGHLGTKEKSLVYKHGHRVKLFKCDSVFDRFREPRFAKNMMSHHTPMSYEKATQLLVRGMAGQMS